MKTLLEVKSFESFKITKQSMSKINGSRSKDFTEIEGICAKVIDDNESSIIKIKAKDRYEGRC